MGWILYGLSQKDQRMGRVAVCFAGLPRLNQLTMPLWQKFISDNRADVFIHTWLESSQVRDHLSMQICELLQPKQLLIEPIKKFNTARFSERIWPHRSQPSNVLSMWYSIKKSIGLCMDWQDAVGEDYDVICRARFDWWFKEINLESNTGLTVPDDPGLSGHRFKYQGTPYIAHNDQFGYGNRTVMQHYSETFDRIPWLYSDDGVDFCSELFLTANMISRGIPVNYQMGMEYRILK